MLWWLLITVLNAATPEQVSQRLADIEALRELRVEKTAPRPSAADVRKAAQGTVVSGLIGRKAWAVAVMDVPIGKLWAGLNDETRQPGYTSIAYAELISGSLCKSNRRVFQYLPVPMISDRWWIGIRYSNSKLSQASGGSVREMYWRSSTDPTEVTSEAARKLMANAEPIGSTRGGWLLVAIDSFSTYVEYYANSDPGAGVPTSITNRLAAKGVRSTIEAMEKFAKEGRPVCPVY